LSRSSGLVAGLLQACCCRLVVAGLLQACCTRQHALSCTNTLEAQADACECEARGGGEDEFDMLASGSLSRAAA
jgi:hypothetical protein